MHTINKVILVGNVAAHAQTTTRENEAEMVLTTQGASRPHGDELTHHRLTLYGDHARTAIADLIKGDRVYVEGSIVYGNYDRARVRIIVRELVVLSCYRDVEKK